MTSLAEMSLFHSRVEGTLSEVIWLARAHSAGITVWQNFRDMSLPFSSLNSLEKVCFVLKRSLWGQPQTSLRELLLQSFLAPVWTSATWNCGFSPSPPSPTHGPLVPSELLSSQSYSDGSSVLTALGALSSLSHALGSSSHFALKILHYLTTGRKARNEATSLSLF